MSDGKVIYEVRADDSKVNNDLDQAQRKVEQGSGRIGTAAKNVAVAVGAALATMAAAAGAAGVMFAAKGVQIASDLAEVQNVVDVAFGRSADKIDDWAKTATNAYGLSELAAKQYTGTMGAMLKSMNVSGDATVEMSTNLAGLAGDMASFYNLDHDDAWTKIRSGIAGETEPLKQLGINMSVANLEAFALKDGLGKTYAQMSQSEQTVLRYNYLMSVTADAQGDFARTSGSWANQLRTAKLNIDNMSASIGKQLLPSLTGVLQTFNKVAEESGGDARLFIANLDKVVEAGAQAAKEMLPLVTSLMKDVLNGIVSVLPDLIDMGGEIVMSLVDGIIDSLPEVANALGQIAAKIVGSLPEIIGSLLVAIPQIIEGFVNGLLGIEDQFANLREETDDLIESLNTAREIFDDNVGSIDDSAGAAKALADELYELEGKSNKSNNEIARMKLLVDQLNGLYPDLNLQIDENTGALNLNEEAVRRVIDANLEQLKINAYGDEYTRLLKERIALENQREEAIEAANAAAEKGPNSWKFAGVNSDLNTANAAIKDIDEALQENQTHLDDTGKEYEKLSLTALAATSKQKEGVIKDTREMSEEQIAAYEDWKVKIEEAEKAHNDAMGTIYDEGLKTQEISLKQATKNLEQQVEDMEKYRENMRIVASKVPPDVYAELDRMGPEISSLIADIAESKPEELQPFVDAMKEKFGLAHDMSIEEIGKLPGSVSDKMQNVKDTLSGVDVYGEAVAIGESITGGVNSGIAKKLNEVVKTVQRLVNMIINAAKKAAEMASPSKRMEREFGIHIPGGAAVGIEKGTSKAVKATEKMVNEIANASDIEKSMSRTLTTSAAQYQSNNYDHSVRSSHSGPMLNIEKYYQNSAQDQQRLAYMLEIQRREVAMAIGAKP